MSAGISAHHSRGLAARRAAAASRATTKQRRTAIRRAAEGIGSICIKVSPGTASNRDYHHFLSPTTRPLNRLTSAKKWPGFHLYRLTIY
jgi:hypothetical protein